jgi:hypothetical protein
MGCPVGAGKKGTEDTARNGGGSTLEQLQVDVVDGSENVLPSMAAEGGKASVVVTPGRKANLGGDLAVDVSALSSGALRISRPKGTLGGDNDFYYVRYAFN